MSLRDRKKRQTRLRLIRAALELVTERGLENVTVEDIARAADVAPRTFFNYFPTKEDALVGPDPESAARLHVAITEAPADRSHLAATRDALCGELAELASDHKLWSLLVAVMERHPELTHKAFAGSAQAERAMAAGIAARAGLLPTDHYPMLLAAAAGTAVRVALTRWSAIEDAPELPVLLAEAFDLLAEGLPDPR